ncbi:MAG: hypothetical protein K9L82_03840 [Chromatiaceae bacterium]|nr:hypothetical protein [Chromatiaceae bacterium]
MVDELTPTHKHHLSLANLLGGFMNIVGKDELVYLTSLLLVKHFKNLVGAGNIGFNSRIFQHMLHWEYEFVGIGQSVDVIDGVDVHPEHVVPCAVMIDECRRLIEEKQLSDEEIAKFLQKHWKIVKITKEQARYIDFQLGYKSKMPSGWKFETGETLARLTEANIDIKS